MITSIEDVEAMLEGLEPSAVVRVCAEVLADLDEAIANLLERQFELLDAKLRLAHHDLN
jgi:hypothetical protein